MGGPRIGGRVAADRLRPLGQLLWEDLRPRPLCWCLVLVLDDGSEHLRDVVLSDFGTPIEDLESLKMRVLRVCERRCRR